MDLNKLSLSQFKTKARDLKKESVDLLVNGPGKLEHKYYSIGILKQRIKEIKDIYLNKLDPIVRKKYKVYL